MKNKIILGTAQVSGNYGINNKIGVLEEESIFKILEYAYENGIKVIDTANAYGKAEKIIGEFIKYNGIKDVRIITKLNINSNYSFHESFNKSLSNLGSIDTIMFHSYGDCHKNIDKSLNFLSEYKNSYNKIGLSLYENNEFYNISDNFNFDIIQLPFNLIDNENLRGNLLRNLKENNIETHVRSIFLQGLFFMNSTEIPENLSYLKDFLNYIDDLCLSYNINKFDLAIQYALSKKYIDGVLMGVDSIKQLKENLKTLDNDLNLNLLSKIDNINCLNTILLNPKNWKNQKQ